MKSTRLKLIRLIQFAIIGLVISVGYLLASPAVTLGLISSLGFENRYSFTLKGHSLENLAAPPDIEIHVGEKITAVKIESVFFMPYTAPHLEAEPSEAIKIEASENAKETFLIGVKAGKSKVYYDLSNIMPRGQTNEGFTVTVKEP